MVGCAALLAAPAAAAASPTAVHAPAKHRLHVQAAPEHDHVKAHEKTHIKGQMDVSDSARTDSAEVLIVQQLVAGAWVNLTPGTCRPNGMFSIDVSFDVAATVSLRVYHPESSLYLESVSNVFALVVI